MCAGVSKANCTVAIVNDQTFEKPEEFHVMLGSPMSESAGTSRLGAVKEMLITIKDDADSKQPIRVVRVQLSLKFNSVSVCFINTDC